MPYDSPLAELIKAPASITARFLISFSRDVKDYPGI
jgi:hypothetical protein